MFNAIPIFLCFILADVSSYAQYESSPVPYLKKNGNYIYVDSASLKPAFQKEFAEADFFNSALARVTRQKDGKYGFIDKLGNQVTGYIYKRAGYQFSDGLMKVCDDQDNWGFINNKGIQVIPFLYKSVTQFNEGVASVKKDGKYGLIDIKGNVIVPFQYDEVILFSEGLSKLYQNKKVGFVDKNGRLVIPMQYADAAGFAEGLALVVNGDKKGGFINKGNETVIPFVYEHESFYFVNGHCAVKYKGKYGVIDKGGNNTLPFQYDAVLLNKSTDIGIARKGEKWCVVNRMLGKELTGLLYDDMREPAEGRLGIKKNNKWGFLDYSMRQVIANNYDQIGDGFHKGLAAVALNDKWGVINLKGNVVIPSIYDEISIAENGWISAELNGSIFIINSAGAIYKEK